MAIEKAIYTAHARATGGRVGTATSDDGKIDLKLDRPIEMGGKGNGTNPEQLFAAGYAACFIGALRVVAGKRHIRVPEDVSIDSAVSFGPLAGGVEGFGIAVSMTIHLPGIERAIAEELVHLAHQTCPYGYAAPRALCCWLHQGFRDQQPPPCKCLCRPQSRTQYLVSRVSEVSRL